MERLYGLVFAAKRMVKGAATLTSFALSTLMRKLIILANCLLPRSGLGKEGPKNSFAMLKSTKRARF